MINRALIRLKVVQIVYAYYQNGGKNLDTAEKELFFSLNKAYDLYNYLLLLMVEVTKYAEKCVLAGKSKMRPTPEELNPNMKFIENRFVAQLECNEQLCAFTETQKKSWDNDEEFVKSFYEKIQETEYYQEYMADPYRSYEADRELWRKIYKNLIFNNPELDALLEEQSLYWNDDKEIVDTFVLKTIKQFSEANGESQALLPMFKDDDDAEFAKELFRNTLLHGDEYRSYIENFIRNWEIERVAFMDIVIMMVAMSEFYKFPSIPTRVTLNEYIELAKSYSTAKSGQFVNGVLNAIADNLKKEGVLTKE